MHSDKMGVFHNDRFASGDRDDSFYSAMNDDDVVHHHPGLAGDDDFDEEEFGDALTVNWCLFCVRVFSVFLMFGMITMFALGKVDDRFFILGAIIFGVFACCLITSFFDCCKKRYFVSTYGHEDDTQRFSGKSRLISEKEHEKLEKMMV